MYFLPSCAHRTLSQSRALVRLSASQVHMPFALESSIAIYHFSSAQFNPFIETVTVILPWRNVSTFWVNEGKQRYRAGVHWNDRHRKYRRRKSAVISSTGTSVGHADSTSTSEANHSYGAKRSSRACTSNGTERADGEPALELNGSNIIVENSGHSLQGTWIMGSIAAHI